MSTTLIFLLIVLVCFMTVYLVAHWCKKLQDENKKLKEEVEKQKETVIELYKHAEDVAKIQKDKSQVNQKIKEAQTDEEIHNIIAGILAANNSRVRK